MKIRRNDSSTGPQVRAFGRKALVVVFLGLAALRPLPAAAQEPTSEQIQRQREEAERRRLEYLDQKRRVDHINERVRAYKELMASVPFEAVPGTTNLAQVFVNGHDVRQVAHRLYFLADGADEQGFERYYWPMFQVLNQTSAYDPPGMPQYGRLDAGSPEINVAVFPNVRKQEFVAVVAQVTAADSALAVQMTTPVVAAYRQRLEELVQRGVADAGDVPPPTGPAWLDPEPRVELCRGMPTEPRAAYPKRHAPSATEVAAARESVVAVDQPVSLDPAPPAWSLRQGINMLGAQYEGYNLNYTPDKLDMQPEVGPILFMGGRDPEGQPRTQPGLHFGLSQRVFDFLLVNESAFVAFSAGKAPAVNGGSLSAGLDIDIGPFNVSGLAGVTLLHVVGRTASGLSLAGKARAPLAEHVSMGLVYRLTNIERFRVEERDSQGNLLIGRSGVTNAGYAGISFILH